MASGRLHALRMLWLLASPFESSDAALARIRRQLVELAGGRWRYRCLLIVRPRWILREFWRLLRHATTFFRDPALMEVLRQRILPGVLAAAGGRTVRIWVPACSTGEEAYSIAILAAEILGGRFGPDAVSILGTDVAPQLVESARLGCYPATSLDKVSPERLQRFFKKSRDGYALAGGIREVCAFDVHDLVRNRYPEDFDLISCRNVISWIQRDSAGRRSILSRLRESLRPSGFLIVGRHEPLEVPQDLFAAFDGENRVFAVTPGAPATELVPTWGSRMRPHIPHKSLVGVSAAADRPPVPGDILVVRRAGWASPQRVVASGGDQGPWLCMADNDTVPCEVGPGALAGRAVWRCWKGRRRSLDVRVGPALGLFLGIRRLEARIVAGSRATPDGPRVGPFARALLAYLAVPRRLLCPWLHGADDGDPGRRESPYLVHTLTAALFPVAAPPPSPPDGLDWDAALSLAFDHGIAPLVGPLWAGLPTAERPPARVLAALEAAGRRSEAAWERALEVLRSVVPALRAHDIPVLLLKGPAVAWSCYRRPVDRTFGDLDLLVPGQMREAAIAVLEQSGFRAKLGSLGRGLLARAHFHIVLYRGDGSGPPIELHWGLFDRANLFRIDEAGLFRRARTLELPGVRVGTLSRVDEFIYLCLHLYRHGVLETMAPGTTTEPHEIALPETGNRLIWFVDLLGFLERDAGGIRREDLWERARDWNAEEEVGRCLLLLTKLFPRAGADALLPGGARAHVPLPGAVPAPRTLPGWVMRPIPGLVFRPVRLLELARLFFPPAAKLRRFSGASSTAGTLGARLLHPARMARRMFLSR